MKYWRKNKMIDLKQVQKGVYQNKLDKGFNVTDINKEFCLIYGEVSEAYEAWRKKKDDVGEEIADVVIYLLGLSEILNVDLESELLKRKNGLNDNSLSESEPKYDFDTSIIDLLTETNYLDKNIFELNKKIEQKFIINYEDLIIDFLSNIKGDNRYDFCVKLRNKFTPDEIYNIELMLPEERNAYLKKTLSEEEYKVYEIYLASNKFNMEDFIDYLNRLIELNDPTVVVLVPNDKVNYDYIDKNIKTKVSDGIYKGIKILYRNKVYDFSLNEGNVIKYAI